MLGQKVKEIGIRKVLGATVGQITIMLSKEFVFLVFIAFGIAIPLVYFNYERMAGDLCLSNADFCWLICIGDDCFAITEGADSWFQGC